MHFNGPPDRAEPIWYYGSTSQGDFSNDDHEKRSYPGKLTVLYSNAVTCPTDVSQPNHGELGHRHVDQTPETDQYSQLLLQLSKQASWHAFSDAPNLAMTLLL